MATTLSSHAFVNWHAAALSALSACPDGVLLIASFLVAGMVPFWCLLPLSWAVAIGLVTWVVGCACLHRRMSSRRGGKRLEHAPSPQYISDARAETILSNALRHAPELGYVEVGH